MSWIPDNHDWLPDPARPRRRPGDPAPTPPAPDALPCIVLFTNRCPWCRHPKFTTDRTQRSTDSAGATRVYRYHKCSACGRRFKSIENLPADKKGKK